MDDEAEGGAGARGGTVRRRSLMIGAVGAAAVVSIRPALAQTQASVMHCEIPVPDRSHAGQWIASDGSLVPANTAGAFRPPSQPIPGEAVKQAMANHASLPGVSSDASKAYLNYIGRLQRGTGGFTCFASLQMPRG